MRRVFLALLRIAIGARLHRHGRPEARDRHAVDRELRSLGPAVAEHVVLVISRPRDRLRPAAPARACDAARRAAPAASTCSAPSRRPGASTAASHLVVPPVLALLCLVLVAARRRPLAAARPPRPAAVNLRLTLVLRRHRLPRLGAAAGRCGRSRGRWRAALDARYAAAGDGLAVAGRTDTGVHALGQVVSVRVAGGPPTATPRLALNAALPDDVVVLDAAEAPDGFHARHSARARAPTSTACAWRATPSALDARRALHHPRARSTARCSTRGPRRWSARTTSRAFTPTETQHADVRPHASTTPPGRRPATKLRFTIAADRFLRHQVRTLVGTMLASARGERVLRTGRAARRRARSAPGRPRRRTGCTSRASGSTGDEPGRSLWESTKIRILAGRYGASQTMNTVSGTRLNTQLRTFLLLAGLTGLLVVDRRLLFKGPGLIAVRAVRDRDELRRVLVERQDGPQDERAEPLAESRRPAALRRSCATSRSAPSCRCRAST